MASEFNQKWLDMLRSIGAKNMPWGITGGNEWISYKQDDENDYSVQIFLHGSFDDYKRQKDAIITFLAEQNSILVNESQVKDVAFGYWRELTFMDEKKHTQKSKVEHIPQIGSIYAPGAIINFGSMSASTISIDNSVHEIERLIEEKGGDDKAELSAVLAEARAILEESSAKKQIICKPKFIERLTGHLSKHGWFYGAILQLLGTAFLL